MATGNSKTIWKCQVSRPDSSALGAVWGFSPSKAGKRNWPCGSFRIEFYYVLLICRKWWRHFFALWTHENRTTFGSRSFMRFLDFNTCDKAISAFSHSSDASRQPSCTCLCMCILRDQTNNNSFNPRLIPKTPIMPWNAQEWESNVLARLCTHSFTILDAAAILLSWWVSWLHSHRPWVR